MSKSSDKSLPDVLRVTYYVLENKGVSYSLKYAADSKQLNGIGEYRVAEIIREICLQPAGPDSMERYTSISTGNMHNLPGEWELTADTYFSFLSYKALNAAKLANKQAKVSTLLAFIAIIVAIITSAPNWLIYW